MKTIKLTMLALLLVMLPSLLMAQLQRSEQFKQKIMNFQFLKLVSKSNSNPQKIILSYENY